GRRRRARRGPVPSTGPPLTSRWLAPAGGPEEVRAHGHAPAVRPHAPGRVPRAELAAFSMRHRGSIGFLTDEAFEQRQRDDLEIEHERPVLEIVDVELDPVAQLLDRADGAAPAVDLSPAGDARLHLVAHAVLG